MLVPGIQYSIDRSGVRAGFGADEREAICGGERRSLGSAPFLARLDKRLERPLARRKPDARPKAGEAPNYILCPWNWPELAAT